MVLKMLKSKYGGISLGDDKDTNNFKYFTYIDFPKFSSEHQSLMFHNLTKKIFEDLHHKITSSGFTFSNAIQSGVEVPSAKIGMVAGDSESYHLFKPLFYRVIKAWHNFDPYTKIHRSEISPEKLDLMEFNKLDLDKYILSSRVRATRNIFGFPLPPGINNEQRKDVENILRSVFKKFTGELKSKYHPLGDIEAQIAEKFRKRGMLFQELGNTPMLFNSGSGRHWPDNRGVFLNKDENLICWVNEEEHCRIVSLQKGANIKSVFENFATLSNSLNDQLEKQGHSLMRDSTLGYLSTCPSNLGTGLRASVKIKIPKLISKRSKLEQICAKYHLHTRSEEGDGAFSASDILDISNKKTLGHTETELVQQLINGIVKIILTEESL